MWWREAFYRAENKQMGQGFIHATVPGESSADKKWDESFSSLLNALEKMLKNLNKFKTQQQPNTINRPGGRWYNQGQGNKRCLWP